MVAPARGGERPPSYVYELVESDEMPVVDLTRSLVSGCCRSCSRRAEPTSSNAPVADPNACHWSVKASWLLSFFLSPFSIISTLRSSRTLDRSLAILAILVNLPFWVFQFRALRFDVVRLLVRTPEFWYFMVSSTLWCGSLAVYLNGLRAVVAAVFFMMSLIIAFVDADTMFSKWMLAIAVLGVAINVTVMALVNRRMVDDALGFAVLKGRSSVLQVEDVIISGLVTNTFHLVRNAYRRYQETVEQRRVHCLLLRCIVYRRRAKLQLVKGPTSVAALAATPCSIVSPGLGMGALSSCVVSATVVRMLSVPVLTTFRAGNTVFPVDLTGPPWRKRTRVAIALAACAGIALVVVAFLGPLESTTERFPHRKPAAVMALALTSASCGLFWSLCQLQLLWHITQSFDFLYLSVQLTLTHVCACEFFGWDERSLAVLSCWLWMHLVLTSDALTPIVRAKTGLREAYLAPVLAIFIAGLIGLVTHVVFIGDAGTGTRAIYVFHVGPRKFEIRALRVFMARLMSVLWWSLRVLARVWTAREGEMVELRMKVAYATNAAAGYNHDAKAAQFNNRGADTFDALRAPVPTNQVAPMPMETQGHAKS